MAPQREVVVTSAVRTAIGRYGGALKDVAPTELGAKVVTEAVQRSGVDPEAVGHTVFANVIHTDPHDMYMARVVSVNGGLPHATPAVTVNRLCGSGLQAVVSASQMLLLGDCEVAVAGGAESMSRGPYWLPGVRWGERMGDGRLIDATVGGLTDPFQDCHMGMTAENVAGQWDVSREDQDAFAVESHQRAARATEEGRFAGQILPIEVKRKRETVSFDTDEHIRADASVEAMAKLKPAFSKDGSVTAGNAAGMNDGAAALVLMDRGYAEANGHTPLARLVSYGFAGVDPSIMGVGPIGAIRQALDRADLKVDDLDTIELNEAFAAQALAVMRDLSLPEDRTNPNGSGISLGHPIGATGAVLTVKALHELERVDGRYGLVTMCIGGGQGIAAVFERMS
ncbi:MAG TPA: acetyl-CoA C-acyltransferase family protein [Euzebyales bacterium]|nr:acetyl-CoA C-acyltransferase family protein [Euzebyales bacterium]